MSVLFYSKLLLLKPSYQAQSSTSRCRHSFVKTVVSVSSLSIVIYFVPADMGGNGFTFIV